MQSLGQIVDRSREAARSAARDQKQPFVYADVAEIEAGIEAPGATFPFPFLGEYIPTGWKRTDTEWFVDSSGFGSARGTALSIRRFIAVLKEYVAEHSSAGFAITQAGEFQVYIGTYERVAQ